MPSKAKRLAYAAKQRSHRKSRRERTKCPTTATIHAPKPTPRKTGDNLEG